MFSTDGEDAWSAVQRIADDGGWSLEFDDAATTRLRGFNGHRQASRAYKTRAEFIADLCREAGVEPPEIRA